MNATMKPLIIAVGLALGASSGAFAQSPTNTPGADTQNKVGGKSVPGSPSAMNPSTTMGTAATGSTATTATTATGNAKNPAFDTQSQVGGKDIPGSPDKSMTKEGKATDKKYGDKKHADKMHADKMHADKMHADKMHTGAKHKTDAKTKDAAFDTQSEVTGKAVPGSPEKPMAGATAKDRAMTKSMDGTATGSMGTTTDAATGKSGKSTAFDTQEKVGGKAVPGTPTTSVAPTIK